MLRVPPGRSGSLSLYLGLVLVWQLLLCWGLGAFRRCRRLNVRGRLGTFNLLLVEYLVQLLQSLGPVGCLGVSCHGLGDKSPTHRGGILSGNEHAPANSI